MTDEELARLIASDTLGLLKVKPKPSPQSSAEARVAKKFGAIVSFIEKHGAPPSRLAEDLDERKLYESLAAIRRRPTWVGLLRPFDEYGVLATQPRAAAAADAAVPSPEPASVEDILNDPILAVDSQDVRSLFNLRHVTARTEPTLPDFIAQRQPCRDFAGFQSKFEACQEDLSAGRRQLLPFVKQQRIEVGKFFTLRGVLLMVASVEEASDRKTSPRRGQRPTSNPRLRCIFENGTESDMLERSLEASLYKDGRRVTELSEDLLKHLLVTTDDASCGSRSCDRGLGRESARTIRWRVSMRYDDRHDDSSYRG